MPMSSPQMTRMFGWFCCPSAMVLSLLADVFTRWAGRHLRGSAANDAAKSYVARTSIDWMVHARRRSVAPAVVRRAQERTALDHLARDGDVGHLRVVALLPVADGRVDAAAAGTFGLVMIPIPIRSPFPNVTRHVEQPVAVRWERPDRRCPLEPVGPQVLDGELALPGVRHILALRRELVSPGVGRTLQPPASGELPLGLGGKHFAHPARVGRDVLVGDMHHRMPLPAVEGAAGT